MENKKTTDTSYWIDNFNERLSALESLLTGLLDRLSTSKFQEESIRSLLAQLRSSFTEFTEVLAASEVTWQEKHAAQEKRLQELETQMVALKQTQEGMPDKLGEKLTTYWAAFEAEQKKFREEARQLHDQHLGLKALCDSLVKLLESEKGA